MQSSLETLSGATESNIILSPAQQASFDKAMAAFESGMSPVIVASGKGMGKSVVMAALHRKTGGRIVSIADILPLTKIRHFRQYETSFYEALVHALNEHDYIYVEDLDHWDEPNFYSRKGMGALIKLALFAAGDARHKKIVFSVDGYAHERLTQAYVPDFQPADYEHICAHYLGADGIAQVDFEKLYREHKTLNGHNLRLICRKVTTPTVTTEQMIEIAAQTVIVGNVNRNNVEKLSLSTLVGIEEIVETLDRSVLFPIREPELAKEYGIEAKHGVLLHGPPGTGKTSIGRALAHSMSGRFFMIDGDWDYERYGCFFASCEALFQAAERNAPSIIFVDDADVMFSNPQMEHWGRFLLTKLDGLHGEKSGKVCVMMTAMNLSDMPLPLLRSGRMDVWLEMKLPEAKARADMIGHYIEQLPFAVPQIDLEAAAEQAHGFTPSDLRRLVSDASGYVGFDRFSKTPEREFSDYLMQAATKIRDQKKIYGAVTRAPAN